MRFSVWLSTLDPLLRMLLMFPAGNANVVAHTNVVFTYCAEYYALWRVKKQQIFVNKRPDIESSMLSQIYNSTAPCSALMGKWTHVEM